MLRVKPDKPLPKSLIAAIRALDLVARQLHLTYFMVGAMARDIVMEHVYGLQTTRATMDIDFAVAVSSWEEFEHLKRQLIATGQFVAGANPHRLIFRAAAGSYPIDLVPFGGVAHRDEIAWPPDGDFVMNVSGYADARNSALEVEIESQLSIKVVSLAVIVVLKILAWNDRPERSKHASDVYLILGNYWRAGQFDRMYADAGDLLQVFDYDFDQAGAALLGRDAGRDILSETRSQVLAVFDSEKTVEKFQSHMVKANRGEIDHAAHLLTAFLNQLGKIA